MKTRASPRWSEVPPEAATARSFTRLSLPISRMFSAVGGGSGVGVGVGVGVGAGVVSGAGAEVSTGAAGCVRGWFSKTPLRRLRAPPAR